MLTLPQNGWGKSRFQGLEISKFSGGGCYRIPCSSKNLDPRQKNITYFLNFMGISLPMTQLLQDKAS